MFSVAFGLFFGVIGGLAVTGIFVLARGRPRRTEHHVYLHREDGQVIDVTGRRDTPRELEVWHR